jgi:secreted Zn-dependent insulinase-like peptidase
VLLEEESGDNEKLAEVDNGTNLETPVSEIWYRSGWVTKSPFVSIKFTLRPLRTKDEPEGTAFDEGRLLIFGRLLGEELVPKMVDLVDTGVTYDINVGSDQLGFAFGGFAPLLPRLVSTVLDEFNRFSANFSCTSQTRFDRVLEDVRKSLATYDAMPVTYALQDRSTLVERGARENSEVLAALENITLEAVMRSVGEILLSRPLRLTSLVMGNVAEGDARDVVETITTGIQKPKWVPQTSEHTWDAEQDGQVDVVTPIVNTSQPVEVRAANPRQGDPNDVTVITVLGGVSTVEQRVVVDLLGQILSSLAYEELRTKRQLGYVVSAGASRISNILHVTALVQGTKLNADEMEGAIELVFTKIMPERLQNMTAEEFENYRTALEKVILEPPITPTDETGMFWGPIQLLGQCFHVRDELLKYLNSPAVTQQSLIDTWADFMVPRDGLRQKVAIKYFAGSVPDRPTPQEVEASWTKLGVTDDVMPMLLDEHNATVLFGKADSSVRAQLLKQGSYFPQELHCESGEPAVLVGRQMSSAFLALHD